MARNNQIAFPCECRVSTAEIASAVSAIIGKKVNVWSVRHHRAKLAQKYCDETWAKDPEKACIGNPYLADQSVGLNHFFAGRRARRLVRELAKICKGARAKRGALQAV